MRKTRWLLSLLLPSFACSGVWPAGAMDTGVATWPEDEAPAAIDPAADAPAADAPPADAEAPGRAPRPAKGPSRGKRPPPKPSPKPAPPAEEAPVDAAPDAPDAPADAPARTAPRGIRQVSDGSWTVTQRLVDRWKESPNDLANAVQSGEGWELRQVYRKEATFLGMKNKDLILEVNGKKLKTDAQLLAAYLALKNKTEFDVVFVRAGKRMTHHYRIVD